MGASSSSEAQSEDSREWFVETAGKAGNSIRADAVASGAGAGRPDCPHVQLHERAAREGESDMNPYAVLGSGVGTEEAASLCARLTAWHDAMVAHERRLRAGRTVHGCDEDCPHVEARTLWAEALATFGQRANDLAFLRSRATVALESAELTPATPTHSETISAAERPSRALPSATTGRPKLRTGPSRQSNGSAAELRS